MLLGRIDAIALDAIAGLPVHPLIVHAVVIVLPVVSLLAIGAAVRPRWRSWLPALIVASLVAVVLALVAEQSGEALASRIGDPGVHVERGEWVKLAAGAQFAALVALWASDRGRQARSAVSRVLAATVVLAAAAGIGTVVLAGHSGAQAVWGSVIENTVPGGADE